MTLLPSSPPRQPSLVETVHLDMLHLGGMNDAPWDVPAEWRGKLRADLKKHITVISGDITDITSLLAAMEGIDYVFNPAAIVPVLEARQALGLRLAAR